MEVALGVREGVAVPLADRDIVTVVLALREGEADAVFVCVEPKDWLGEPVGERDADTDGVTEGGTHELSTTEPASPAAPAVPPPTLAKALKAAIGQEALRNEEPPPPLAGT